MKLKLILLRVGLLFLITCFFSPINTQAQEHYYQEKFSHADSSLYDAKKLLQKIEEENDPINSVAQNVGLFVTVESALEQSSSTQLAFFELLFNANQEVEGGYLYSEYEEEDDFSFEETFLPSNEKAIWYRSSQQEEWINDADNFEEEIEYFVNPNYHQLIDSIFNAVDTLEIYEDEEYFILVNKDQSLNLFYEFQPQYNLYVSGIDSDELATDILILFNKESLLLEEFNLTSYYESDHEYIEINVITTFEMWNEFDDNYFYLDSEDDLEEWDEGDELDDIDSLEDLII